MVGIYPIFPPPAVASHRSRAGGPFDSTARALVLAPQRGDPWDPWDGAFRGVFG